MRVNTEYIISSICNIELFVPELRSCVKVEVLGGCPGLPVPNSPSGPCGRKATLNYSYQRAEELCESRGGRPGLPVLTVSVGVKQH